MPIPSPDNNEDKDKFVARCMSSETMKKEYSNPQQRVAICLGQTRSNEHSLIEEVQTNLAFLKAEYDDEWDEFVIEVEIKDVYDEDNRLIAAEKNGRKVKLNKPFRTPDGPKKFSVYVKNDKGNVVKVNFGDPERSIKRDSPERRKNFRARHGCDNPGPKYKAKYWSCKFWSNKKVSDLT